VRPHPPHPPKSATDSNQPTNSRTTRLVKSRNYGTVRGGKRNALTGPACVRATLCKCLLWHRIARMQTQAPADLTSYHIILRCRRHRTADIRFRGDVRCAEILICQPLYTERSDVTESMATTRSSFCGYNMVCNVWS